jgi:hypothetical protein
LIIDSFAITTWELVSDGLGIAAKTVWSPVDPNDYSKGMIASNADIETDYDQCNTAVGKNSFEVMYYCGVGDNSVKIIGEPSVDKNGPCMFVFGVDSSVICDYYGSSSSSTGPDDSSSTGPDEPSSSSSHYVPPATQCSTVAASYNAPFDLSQAEIIMVPSANFPGGTYYVQPCGQTHIQRPAVIFVFVYESYALLFDRFRQLPN